MNKKTKLINEIVDLILAKGLLNEIGEGTSTYPIKSEKIRTYGYRIDFDVTSDTGEAIDSIRVYGSIDKITIPIEDGLPIESTLLDINFMSMNTRFDRTHSKYPLKVMSTVVDCVKKVLNSPEARDVNVISFESTGSTSKEISQKYRLYSAYLQKNLHSIKGRTFIEPSKESREILMDTYRNSLTNNTPVVIDKDLEIKIATTLTRVSSEERSAVSAVELETDLKYISDVLRTIGEIFNAYKDFDPQEVDYLRNSLKSILLDVDKMSFSFREYITDRPSIDLSNDWRRDDGTIDVQKVSKWFTVQSYIIKKITAIVNDQVNNSNEKKYSNFMHELGRVITVVRSGVLSLQHILSFALINNKTLIRDPHITL